MRFSAFFMYNQSIVHLVAKYFMSLILSLETTTNVCSVAIHEDNKLIALKENHASQSHSRLLAVYIKNILSESQYKVEDLDAVAVSKGPGSYTGVRIGVSTAKGLCYALAIPLIAINTLEAMAYQEQKFLEFNCLLCPMIDARRMEVYTLLKDTSDKTIMQTTASIIDENSFASYLDLNRIIFFGNGSDKCKSVIKHPNALFLDSVFPSASSIGHLAFKSYQQEIFEDLAYFEPYYLKDFQAGKPKQL